VAKEWIDDATWWPIEAAIVWIATGNPRLTAAGARFALKRRESSQQKLPSLGHWLVVSEGLAREI
jgi:hypothetical protein